MSAPSNVKILPLQPDGTVRLFLLAGDTDKQGATVDAFADELAIPRAVAQLIREPEEDAVAAYQDESEDFWDWVEDRRCFLDTFQTEEVIFRVDPTLRTRHLEDLLLEASIHLRAMYDVLPAGVSIAMARSGWDEGAQRIVKEVDAIRQHRQQHGNHTDTV
jgi:hypothetical protein